MCYVCFLKLCLFALFLLVARVNFTKPLCETIRESLVLISLNVFLLLRRQPDVSAKHEKHMLYVFLETVVFLMLLFRSFPSRRFL